MPRGKAGGARRAQNAVAVRTPSRLGREGWRAGCPVATRSAPGWKVRGKGNGGDAAAQVLAAMLAAAT